MAERKLENLAIKFAVPLPLLLSIPEEPAVTNESPVVFAVFPAVARVRPLEALF
jgi:hypothetical protein